MKASYWIILIIVTSALAFAVGRNTAQQATPNSDRVIDSKSTSNDKESSLEAKNTLSVNHNAADKLLSNLSESSPSSMEDIVAEVGELLAAIEKNPRQAKPILKLVALLEALSTEELLALAPLFENSDEFQRNQLYQIMTAQLIEKAPEQALAFAQRYNPMPDFPNYSVFIKAQIAEKRPDLGFEYLNQMLEFAHEDIDLSANSTLLNVLAKADLPQLIDTLEMFKDMGVSLKNSLTSIGFELETSEEHLNLFNELRRLDDMSILKSAIIDWVKIDPTALFERLNQIEDIAERENLEQTAFYFWMSDSPEDAANHFLANASNEVKTLKDIMRAWPNKRADDALAWISEQSNIDTNRFKIDFLKKLSYSEPEVVQSHLADINLNDDEKIDFYRNLYNSFKSKSSKEAEQFLNTLSFKDEILDVAAENENSGNNRIAKINQAFNKYFDFKYKKAFALALGDNGAYAYFYVVNKPSQHEANQLALSQCEQYRYKHNVSNKCEIYAEGDVRMFNLVP
ncbi:MULTISPECIES: hypothetical protein [unclassified Alteromonas]|uniref:hypothetical protein n=1 Tax=unclassified Alteromonas TaxID=2614992 RepID=UPI000509600C|nr:MULTISPECIES: hypothetical protein [unclassified Alteromonas]